jgi:hypothetical protein
MCLKTEMFPVIQPQNSFFLILQLRHADIQISQLLRPTPVSSQLTLSRGISIGGAGRGIEPGPAVQQADALLSEQRRALS